MTNNQPNAIMIIVNEREVSSMRDIRLEITCPFCGKSHFVEVAESDYNAWQNGELAQNAFPYLSATEREQLISHICPQCQADIFGE